MNTLLIIQVLLIAMVVLVVARLFRSRGARAQAIRRLGLVAFAAFAAVSILFPDVWSRLARLVGVGRGTDLVLYVLCVTFLFVTIAQNLRLAELHDRTVELARKQALLEAELHEREHQRTV